MLIPIGLDETRLARLPWVSIVLLALNVLVFAAMSIGSAEDAAQARFREVIGYWAERPYLDVPVEMDRRFGITREKLARGTGVALREVGGPAFEQEHLDALCEELFAAHDELPSRQWGLVPERGALQPGWLTYQFVHGGFGHLLGNMLVFFLVVAPFLEDAWGRPFFAAFYLLGGVVAGIAQVVPMGDSPVAIVGASGAISACLGAFALRFAHRRVRMLYWFFLLVRGSFFVPAWAYAFFGLSMDLLSLTIAGTGGGVAYAAHVGGFLFGVGAAIVVRATGLEARIAPEGAARWGGSLAASRAEDALAGGRVHDARALWQAALAKRPDDPEALLGLARIEAGRSDAAAATPLVEKLVAARIAARDVAGAREILAELGHAVDASAFRPATAYRAAELALSHDPDLADRLDEAAAAAGGGLGAKALVRLAERLRAKDPARALALAERALALDGIPLELTARARSLADEVRPAVPATTHGGPIELPDEEPGPAPEVLRSGGPPAPTRARDVAGVAEAPSVMDTPGVTEAPGAPDGRTAADLAALPPGEPVRVVRCQLVGASEAGFHLATHAGKRALLAPERVEALAAALLAEHADGGATRRNAVVLDVLLAPRAGEAARVVLRIPGHAMALAAIHPGVAPKDAFARVVEALLAGGARAAPSVDEAAGRPFARFPDAAAFEQAAWGRRLAA